MRCSKSNSKREVHMDKSLPCRTRKVSNNLTLHLKELEKKMMPKVSRRKEITKIRAEIHKTDFKKSNRQDQ